VLPRLNDVVGQGIKFAVADSFVLPCLLEAVRQGNRQLLVAAKRYGQFAKKSLDLWKN